MDLALRVRTKLDTDAELVVRHLGTARGTLVASPGYLQRHGAPDTPQDLAAHTTLSFSDPQHEVRWPLRNDKGEEVHIELKPQLSCNDFIVLVEAAVRGRGIALLPSIATQEELRRGQLMPVLPQWQSPEGIVHCIYLAARHDARRAHAAGFPVATHPRHLPTAGTRAVASGGGSVRKPGLSPDAGAASSG